MTTWTELDMIRGNDVLITHTRDENLAFGDDDVVWFTLKQDLADDDADALVRASTTDGTVSVIGGTATALIPAAATSDLVTDADLHFDWQVKDATGIGTPERGIIRVSRDVTRAVA